MRNMSTEDKFNKAVEYKDRLGKIFTNINRDLFNYTNQWDKISSNYKNNVELLEKLLSEMKSIN